MLTEMTSKSVAGAAGAIISVRSGFPAGVRIVISAGDPGRSPAMHLLTSSHSLEEDPHRACRNAESRLIRKINGPVPPHSPSLSDPRLTFARIKISIAPPLIKINSVKPKNSESSGGAAKRER